MAVDIIIPTYNQPDFLRACLNAVERNTFTDYRLVVADDHSPDPEMHEVLSHVRGDVIYNESGTRGFPHNCNWAAAHSDSEFICLLNSDTEAKAGWLSLMLEEMEEPSVGIVGCKLVYPRSKEGRFGGSVQHAGVARNQDGYPYHIFRGCSPHVPMVNVRREINAVTFACALIRRQLWDRLGGLDEGYVGGQFEDVDFAWAARKQGWKVVYTPRATVLHYEHGSGNDFVQQTSNPNLHRLLQKWGNLDSDEHLFCSPIVSLLSNPQAVEEVARMCYSWRARAVIQTVQQMRLGDFGDPILVQAHRRYEQLLEEERDVAREMARRLLRWTENEIRRP